MIVDLRVYTYLPSKYRKFLKGYEEIGFALTSKHLGKTLGIFRPESGLQNRTFQFFMYRDSPHRDACRRGMLADPAWGEFVRIDSDALLEQRNTLLQPTSFSALQTPDDLAPEPAADQPTRLFELRSWACLPDRYDSMAKLLAEGGAALLARHAPDVLGWFTATTGVDHRLFQLTAYADALARDNSRTAAGEDLEVKALVARLRQMTREEESQLLLPMPYSPTR
ncbi:NIPSNAP family protein [Flavisphingomonas formosensis]|uniref:NIPSNAP family protein n=1 Tax=Flavisphingomonas formosensis TaxID=861534 RepID=UPI0012FB479F|nr:NIPSNAP family protein [Sphingomonas formosensis]